MISRCAGTTNSAVEADGRCGHPICKGSAAIFIANPLVYRSCHSRKAAIILSLNPLHARAMWNGAHSTYRTG